MNYFWKLHEYTLDFHNKSLNLILNHCYGVDGHILLDLKSKSSTIIYTQQITSSSNKYDESLKRHPAVFVTLEMWTAGFRGATVPALALETGPRQVGLPARSVAPVHARLVARYSRHRYNHRLNILIYGITNEYRYYCIT